MHIHFPRLVWWQAILAGGLLAATVDIAAAALIGWLSPVIILHAIASGVLGRQSFFDGAWSALLGLVLQWFMGILIAAIYAALAWRMHFPRRHWIVGGIIYGVVIYLVMNFLVVPWSLAPFKPQLTAVKIVENILAMVLFGLIVSFCVSLPGRVADFEEGRAALVRPRTPDEQSRGRPG